MTNLIALHNEVKTLNSKTAKPQICSRVLSTKLPLNPDPELPNLSDCRSNKKWNKDKGRCGRSLACQSGCEQQLHLAPLSPTEPHPLVPLGWKSNETQFHSSRGVSLRTSHTFKPCTRQEQTYIEVCFPWASMCESTCPWTAAAPSTNRPLGEVAWKTRQLSLYSLFASSFPNLIQGFWCL
jgi:hypothetical protein